MPSSASRARVIHAPWTCSTWYLSRAWATLRNSQPAIASAATERRAASNQRLALAFRRDLRDVEASSASVLIPAEPPDEASSVNLGRACVAEVAHVLPCISLRVALPQEPAHHNR